MVWTLIVFMVVPEGFDYTNYTSMPTEGSPLSRVIWLALLAGGLLIAARNGRQTARLLKQANPWLIAYVIVAGMSVLWSIDPGLTIRRMLRLITMLGAALALATAGWHVKRPQQVLRPILSLLLIASIIFVISHPELGIEQSQSAELLNAWKGLATQKNGFGSITGIALIFWVHAWLAREGNSTVATGGVLMSAFCLLKSRSSTSIMATLFTCMLLMMLLRSPVWLRRYMPYVIGSFTALLLVYSLAVLNLIPGSGMILSPIASLSGKDLTFSGRTEIWQIVNEQIRLHPLLGSGFGAYWDLSPDSPSYAMVSKLGYYPSESHNGYLEVILDLGVPGLVCLFGFIVTYIKQALSLFRNPTLRTQGALYLGLVFHQLISNLSEARWLNVRTVEFVITTLIALTLARTALDLRGQSTPYQSTRRPV